MPMMVCPHCGSLNVEKQILPDGDGWAVAVCPDCTHPERFRYHPLFAVTGASGTGKSSVLLDLMHTQSDVVVLESDMLWGAIPYDADGSLRTYRSTWLRMAIGIAQAGKPVALFGSVVPEDFESAPERRYFTAIHYLALTCEPDEHARRLRARPEWRGSGTNEYIDQHIGFNRWLIEHAAEQHPPIDLLDTTHASRETTASAIRAWIQSRR